MKKSDIILMSIIALIAGVGLFIANMVENNSELDNGTAYVIYNNVPILEIYLDDGDYNILRPNNVYSVDEEEFIYIVQGTNGPVTIEYGNDGIRVIDETSPKNVCQAQGWSKSPLKPITCLPNNLVIIIKDDSVPDVIDGING